jgi:hypothetical protein
MTETIAELQRQRQELARQAAKINRQIAAATKAARNAYANRLDYMVIALNKTYSVRDGMLSYQDRKNEKIATINGRNVTITVTFAYPDDNYREGLSISTSDDVRITFEGNLPSTSVFMMLITALSQGDTDD